MKKIAIILAAALSGAAVSAHASLISFDINTSLTQGGNGNVADEATRFFTLADTSQLASKLVLSVDPDTDGKTLTLSLNSGGFAVTSLSTDVLKLYSAGDVLSGSAVLITEGSTTPAYAMSSNAVASDWTSDFSNSYLAFVTAAGNYGYVQASWNYNASSHKGSLSLGSGVLETTAGKSLTIVDPAVAAGQVPEPGSIAILGIGLLGVAASRRKRIGKTQA
jgi:hypothetical protein